MTITIEEKLEVLPLEVISPNPQQPRKFFDQVELQGLSESIAEHGVLQPITVEGPHTITHIQQKKKKSGGKKYSIEGEKSNSVVYYIIAGERRYRASRMAGLKEIKCIVRAPMNGNGPEDRAVLSLMENLQRADLSVIEEARAYKKMHDEYGFSQMKIANKLGINQARVGSRMQLLELEPRILEEIESGRLPKERNFVEALLSIKDSSVRVKLAILLANRKASAKAGIEACARMNEKLMEETISPDELPAMKLTIKKTGELRRPLYDVMAAIGKVPPWLLVEICARDVCGRCELREVASDTTCRGCTLVEFLREMVGSVNEGKR